MMKRGVCVILTLAALFATVSCERANVVLVGATGDLARKYLWGSLFKLYSGLHDGSVRTGSGTLLEIYGAARNPEAEGRVKVASMIEEVVPCGDEGRGDCLSKRAAFTNGVRYVQLKEEEHWKALCHSMDAGGKEESLRVFYLSIPPTAYGQVSSAISRFCRPKRQSVKLRVAFEKPFGSSLQSAAMLNEETSMHFRTGEVLHVDHYLGKPLVRDLLRVRGQSPDLQMLDMGRVSRIDVVIAETIGVEGRTAFYNGVGVVRDVLQNHATELLTLVCADLPELGSDFERAMRTNRARFIQSLTPTDRTGGGESAESGGGSLLTGQYEGYQQEVVSEGGKGPFMPTFASVGLTVASPESKWNDVKFVLTAGKRMATRESYVRIYLHDGNHTSCAKTVAPPLGGFFVEPRCERPYIHLQIQGNHRKPGIYVVDDSDHPVHVNVSGIPGWSANEEAQTFTYDDHEGDSAYDYLFKSLVLGKHEMFGATETVLSSWEIWDEIVRRADATNHFSYKPGDFVRKGIMVSSQGALSLEDAGRIHHDDL